MNNINRRQGFTLVEMLVVVAIMGIVAAIASSSYGNYIIAAKRTDARKALQENATILEKCKVIYGIYNNTGCSVGGSTVLSAEGLYSIQFTTLTKDRFMLTASPVAALSQVADSECTTLTLNNLAQQAGSGSNPTVCW